MNELLLAEKRLIGDTIADRFIQAIFADLEKKAQLQQWLANLKSNQQLAELPAEYQDFPLFNSIGILPDWAKTRFMRKGAEFFATHNKAILNLLGLLSLPYCYAAANGAMVLFLSERMRTDVEKRLYETAAFLWEIMAPDAFAPDGNGFVAILKVRLMHAAARYYALKNGKWDHAWGYPVNQEDMVGTNLSFSLIVIRGLRKFGYTIGYEQQTAYLHLWNVIGYLLGVDQGLIPFSGKDAVNLERGIRVRQFKPSEQGKELTGSLVNYFQSVNDGKLYSNRDIEQLMRYLLGDEVAEILDLKNGSLSEGKIRLLRLKNLIQELTVSNNTRMLYGEAFHRFKQFKTYS